MQNIYTFKNLSTYQTIQHLVTKKETTHPYSFSLALHTHEEPADIIQNRNDLKKNFPTMNFIVANQTHSANITIIEKSKDSGWSSIEDAIEDCDALITNTPNTMLTILTADCVPILLFDPKQKVVAAIHAGWRGTKQQIVKKTIKKMQEKFQSKPSEIIAGVAPSIGRCCYEVDWSVAQHFEKIKDAYDKQGNKYMLDLPLINQIQLLESGVKKEHIEMSNICTACEVKEYFSYRKEQGCSGRFMSMIGVK
jgi:YfiH family protein